MVSCCYCRELECCEHQLQRPQMQVIPQYAGISSVSLLSWQSASPVSCNLFAKPDLSHYRDLLLFLSNFHLCLMRYCKPWITPWDPYKVPLVIPGCPQTKSWYYKKKLNCLTCIADWVCFCSFATISEISECCVRTIVQRANYEVFSSALSASVKTLLFLQNTFLSHTDNAFMWVQDYL